MTDKSVDTSAVFRGIAREYMNALNKNKLPKSEKSRHDKAAIIWALLKLSQDGVI